MTTVTFAAAETVTFLQELQAQAAETDAATDAARKAKSAALDAQALRGLEVLRAQNAAAEKAEADAAAHARAIRDAKLGGALQFLATNAAVSVTLPDDPAPAGA